MGNWIENGGYLVGHEWGREGGREGGSKRDVVERDTKRDDTAGEKDPDG